MILRLLQPTSHSRPPFPPPLHPSQRGLLPYRMSLLASFYGHNPPHVLLFLKDSGGDRYKHSFHNAPFIIHNDNFASLSAAHWQRHIYDYMIYRFSSTGCSKKWFVSFAQTAGAYPNFLTNLDHFMDDNNTGRVINNSGMLLFGRTSLHLQHILTAHQHSDWQLIMTTASSAQH